VKYAVALAGPVTLDSSIRLDTNPITCNGDVAVVVNEVAKSSTVDAGCNSTNGCTSAATIGARTGIVVKTATGTQVDQEIAPVLTKDPNALSFSVEADARLDRSRIPTPTTTSWSPGDGYVVTATYNDQDCTLDGTAGCQPLQPNGQPAVAETVQRSSTATFDCTPERGLLRHRPARPQLRVPPRGRVRRRQVPGQTVRRSPTSCSSRTSRTTLTLEDVNVTLRAVSPDADNVADPGRLNNSSSPVRERGRQHGDHRLGGPRVPRIGRLQHLRSAALLRGRPAPARPPEVELVVGITSTKAGKSSASYGAFKHILNGTLEKFRYSTDYPTGRTGGSGHQRQREDREPDPGHPPALPDDTQENNWDKLNESITFSDLTTTSFGGGNPGFSGPWDFDVTDEGFRSGLYVRQQGQRCRDHQLGRRTTTTTAPSTALRSASTMRASTARAPAASIRAASARPGPARAPAPATRAA
jgi:hypothetical protein